MKANRDVETPNAPPGNTDGFPWIHRVGTPLLVLHIEPAGAITVSDFNPSASRLFDHQLAKGSLLDTLLDVETLDTLKPIIHNTHNLEPGPGTPFHLHQKNGHTRVLVCRVCLLDQQHHLLLTLVDKTGGSTLLPPPKNIAMLSDETKAILNWLPVAIEISSANINTADTLFINNKFFEIFGYTPEQDVITLDEWWEVAYPDPSYRKLVSETWLAAVKEATEKGMDMPPQIWEVHCKDGSKKNIEFRFRAIGDKYVNVYVDVTEQLALAAALRKQANIDPLTNIANRRYFFQQADDFILQASQRLTPLSVLIMDIDFFKIINDRYGHEHGDETLKEIVLRTQHCLSTSALFARMGGEEFAILLPDTPLELANQIAWQICEHIGQTPVRVLDNEIPVTTSIGVATLSSTEHDINSVLRRADEALYKAKATGRNRVVSAT